MSRDIAHDLCRITFHERSSCMHPRARFAIILSLLLTVYLSLAFGQTSPAPSSTNKAALAENYGKLPLSFEANQGQTDPQVRFLSRGHGYSLFLTDSAAVLALTKGDSQEDKVARKHSAGDRSQAPDKAKKTDVVRMQLAGASPGLKDTGADQLPGTANYFIGNDPNKWHNNVPTYAKVEYAGVYPGVDLVYYGNQSQLEYDFVVAPEADPGSIHFRFSGTRKLKLDGNGD